MIIYKLLNVKYVIAYLAMPSKLALMQHDAACWLPIIQVMAVVNLWHQVLFIT